MMTKKTKIGLVVVIVLLIAGMAFYPQIKGVFSGDGALEKAPVGAAGGRDRVLNVNVQVLKYRNLDNVFRTKGILIPDEEVDLSFETSGKITQIYFKEGSTVRKGELLAKVNDAPLQAELKKLVAQKPLAEERVYRQKTLLEKDAVSQESYETVSTDLDKLNADIELTKSKIDQTELRAPFDGVIGLRLVSEGAYTTPATIISKLTKISPLKIEFSVNEKQAGEIRPGTRLNFTLDNDLQQYQATVYAVESKLDVQTLSLKARALYANPGGRLKPGHSTDIEIKLAEIRNALLVPSLSTVTEMGEDIVYLYKSGKAERTVMTKGIRTASAIQAANGLLPGDTLIISGVMQLREGMQVRLSEIQE
jgi:membrane fusion protein (multidrug efflux system)